MAGEFNGPASKNFMDCETGAEVPSGAYLGCGDCGAYITPDDTLCPGCWKVIDQEKNASLWAEGEAADTLTQSCFGDK